MKYSLILLAFFASIIFIATSCGKPATNQPPRETARTIQFSLFTTHDFSDDNHNITFTTKINRESQLLWDSVLPTMKIKDIPDMAHKLSLEKTVLVNDTAVIKVEFYYTIENVGDSWLIDTSGAHQTFKVFNFNFQ